MTWQNEILKKVVEINGKEHQFRQLQEECGELIVAVSHYLRSPSEKNRKNLLEELGDVDILLKQLDFILSCEDRKNIKLIQYKKIERLAKRITRGKAK